MMLTSSVDTIKHQEIAPVYYVQSDKNKKNYFQDTVTETFYDIVFKFIYNDKNSLTDTSNFKLLAKQMKKHFSPGLIVNVKFGDTVNYLELKNPQISEEKLFDEYWNFREEVWFNLPKDLTSNRHLAMG
ncbi:hypothetical protein [Limosilactobacillus vaginalis]|uniref:hypothetical protein n=1 Tax=Limosilactobacillus vaginalis TaxID=1633 RepID=UPI003207987A